jgi:hypothetical protein
MWKHLPGMSDWARAASYAMIIGFGMIALTLWSIARVLLGSEPGNVEARKRQLAPHTRAEKHLSCGTGNGISPAWCRR